MTQPEQPVSPEAPAPMPRIVGLDVLRGFAVLGILIMNVLSFALPEACYTDPAIVLPPAGATGVHFGAEAMQVESASGAAALRPATFWPWLVSSLLVDMKFIAIFCMLFGAGAVLFDERLKVRAASSPPLAAWVRRCFVLLAIGLAHGMFLWHGDILHAYALCGLLLWLARRLSTVWLWTLGVAGTLIAALSMAALSWFASHEQPSWLRPPADSLADEIGVYRGAYSGVVAHNATQFMWTVLWGFPFYTFWRAAGLMLIGMALARAGAGALPGAGALASAASQSTLKRLILIGYGVGVPITIAGIAVSIATRFDEVAHHVLGQRLVELGSLPMALGHIAIVLRLVGVARASVEPRAHEHGGRGVAAAVGGWLSAWLAPVGRAALSNYLFQSIACTALFHGWGFGLFAKLNRVELLGVVLAVWVTQVLLTRLWLSRFALGPAEWAWRRMAGNRPTSSAATASHVADLRVPSPVADSTAPSPVADGGGVIEASKTPR